MAGTLEKAFELSVIISAVDRFTHPMRQATGEMRNAQKDVDKVTKALKSMGRSTDDIKRVGGALKTSLKVKEQADDMDKLVKSMRDMGAASKDIDDVVAGMKKLADQQERVDKLTESFNKFKKVAMVGAGMTAAGVGMAGELAHAADEAGRLLTIMTTIQDATGATSSQMKTIQNSIQQTSLNTKFDKFEVADFAKILSTSGYKPQEVASMLPTFAKYAEVQQYGKGTDPEEAIKKAIELGHGLGKYTPESLDTFLNSFNKATFMQPEDTSQFSDTLKYLMTQGKSLDMSDSDILFTAALSNRMGLAGSTGGTSAADMILRAIPGLQGGFSAKPIYGEPTKGATSQILQPNGTLKTVGGSSKRPIVGYKYPRALQAMIDIGIADPSGKSQLFTDDGKIKSIQDFVSTLYSHTKDLKPEKRAQVFHDIFGQQGARTATLLASAQGQEQLRAIVEGQKRIKDTGQMQEDYLNTPEGQLNQARSNIQNMKMQVFLDVAQNLNPLLEKLNAVLKLMYDFGNAHPKIAKYIATFAMMFTALLLIAGPLTSLIGLFGMLRAGLMMLKLGEFIAMVKGLAIWSKIWAGVQWLVNAALDANPIVLIILGIIALIAVIVLLVKHWRLVLHWIMQVYHWYKRMPLSVKLLIASMMPFIGIPLLIISHWHPIERFFIRIWGGIKSGARWVRDEVMKFSGIGDTVVKFFEPLEKFPHYMVTKFEELTNFFKDLPAAMKENGEHLVHGFWDGIKGMGGWLKDKLTNWVKDTVPGPVKKVLGIFSPSRVMKEMGRFSAQGLAIGMNTGANDVLKASNNLAHQVISGRASGSSSASFQTGEVHIHIHTKAGQSAKDIANEIPAALGKQARTTAMNKGLRINFGATN